MASLQEQLLKAGLTTKQKARQANTDKRRKNKQQRSGAAVETSLQQKVQQELEQSRAEKLARDAALNAEKKQQQLAKEQFLRIQQILQHHRITGIDGDVAFNYTLANKIKKLLVDETTHRALVNGRLALCAQDEQVYVVTAETADKVASLDPGVVLVLNDKTDSDALAEDDPYAEFQIPDDLMW